MKVCIYKHDPMLNLVYLKEEVLELFGEEYFEEYNVDVPSELALDVFLTYKKLRELSIQLKKYKKD